MPIKKMNKSDLIKNLSKKLYLFKEDDVEKSVNIIIELISDYHNEKIYKYT